MTEELPFRNRIAAVYAAMEARERRRRRALVAGVVVLAIIPMASLSAMLYMRFVGHQRHMLEVHVGAAAYRISSRTGPFTIEAAGPDRPRLPIAAGMGGYLADTIHSTRVESRTYERAPIAETRQVVVLPPEVTSCVFRVNAITFHATEGELRGGEQTWPAQPGMVVVVDVDRLKRRAGQRRDRRVPGRTGVARGRDPG